MGYLFDELGEVVVFRGCGGVGWAVVDRDHGGASCGCYWLSAVSVPYVIKHLGARECYYWLGSVPWVCFSRGGFTQFADAFGVGRRTGVRTVTTVGGVGVVLSVLLRPAPCPGLRLCVSPQRPRKVGW